MDIVAYYAPTAAEIIDPVILIRINQLYHHGMSDVELYEAIRGVWKLGSRRLGARYACAVFESLVREVYAIDSWHPGGATPYATRTHSEDKTRGRWEFCGRPAPEELRSRYIGRTVEAYLQKGSQNPIAYVCC